MNHIWRVSSYILLPFILLTASALKTYGQTSNTTSVSNGIFFQAIARDHFANPAKDRKVYVQTSILHKEANGTPMLVEEFETRSDLTGIFGISVGLGNRIAGNVQSIASIDWSDGPYYLSIKIAIQPTAPSSNWDYTKEWIELGATPFGSVPYALYSNKTADHIGKLNINDTANMLSNYVRASNLNNLHVISSYNDLTNKPNLFSGNYDSLTNKPNLFNGNYNALTNKPILFSGNYDSLSNKPNLFNGSYNALTNKPVLFSGNYDSLSNKPNLLNFESTTNKSLNIVTDGNLDSKYPSAKAVKTYVDNSIANINAGTYTGTNTVNVVDADANTKGILKLNGDLTGTADAPIIANNAINSAKIANAAITDAKIATGISASKVGLGNVDNTSDLNKPISTATQAALDLKLNSADTANLSALVNSKLNIVDTGLMLS
ncbi:MAG: hypothetical protein RLZ56_68, partial [Bacteroidota bacterium]